ncbi:MAG: hypothetical protein U1F76_28270 [Candidatus Competibacteraceae bacterium]
MNWNQIRTHYPHRWLLIETIKAHTEADRRILEELAVIDAYPNSVTALQSYTRLHREAPERELYVVHTDRTDLQITERRWVGTTKRMKI